MPTRWVTRSSGRGGSEEDVSHNRCRKEAVAGAAPIGGSTGTGSRQGAKARTRRLIQEGAILEKVLPEVQTMELPALEGYLFTEAGKRNLNFRWEVSGKPGAALFFLPEGRTYSPPEGAVVCLRHRALSEGDCAFCGSLQTMLQHLRALLSSSAQTAIPCDERSETGVDILYPCCRLPAQTCHRQLCRREG